MKASRRTLPGYEINHHLEGIHPIYSIFSNPGSSKRKKRNTAAKAGQPSRKKESPYKAIIRWFGGSNHLDLCLIQQTLLSAALLTPGIRDYILLCKKVLPAGK